MEKLGHFLCCKMFQLETDQKPLDNVLAKIMTQATPRLLYLLETILLYDLNVRHIKGSANQLADCLSRSGPLQDKIKLFIVQIHGITCRLQAKA